MDDNALFKKSSDFCGVIKTQNWLIANSCLKQPIKYYSWWTMSGEKRLFILSADTNLPEEKACMCLSQQAPYGTFWHGLHQEPAIITGMW